MRIITTAVLVAATTLLLDAQTQPRFRTGVDLIVVPVVVRDAQNALVRGLTGEDFELREDGTPVTIATFT
jgi:hypothetical protein